MRSIITTVLLLLCPISASAAVFGDSLPPEPKVFTTIVLPVDHATNGQSQALMRATATDPTLVELRRLGQVSARYVNDPDFAFRWQPQKTMPLVLERRVPAVLISYGNSYTPQKQVFGMAMTRTTDSLVANIRRIMPMLRKARPQEPAFVEVQPAAMHLVANSYESYETRTGGILGRIRGPRGPFGPRVCTPETCPEMFPNGPQDQLNPTQPTDDWQPVNPPTRPLLPPIDDPLTPPQDQPVEYPADTGVNDPVPPAPIEPDPRVDEAVKQNNEQQTQIQEQAEEIKKLQATIQQLQSTVVNVQPAKDYAPDINAIKADIQNVKGSLTDFENDQQKINADVVASIKSVMQQRTEVMGELAAMKDELAKPLDVEKLAADISKKLPPVKLEWERLDGTKLTQQKALGEPLRIKSVRE